MHSKFLFILSCFLSFGIIGQISTTSPFSSQGIGEFETSDHPVYSGIGNVNVSIIDSLNLNFFNPSSYSFLSEGQPLFSSGISTRVSKYSENGNTFKTSLTTINHFVLGIPFAKIFGVAFGLKPFSRRGYSIIDKEPYGTDTMKYTYKGSGGLNEAFTGFSIKFLNLKNHKIALGSNFGYIFGSVLNERLSNLNSSYSGGIETTKYQVKSLYVDLGMSYQLNLTKNSCLILAGSYTPTQNLVTRKSLDLYYSLNTLDEKYIVDTISSVQEKGKTFMPSSINVGFSYSFRPKIDSSYNKPKIFQLTLYGSYSTVNWSEYRTSFTSDNSTIFLNTIKYSTGIEFTPHYNYSERTKSVSYLYKVRYRVGFQYETLPIQRLSKQLSTSQISFGLGLPIISQRSVSSLNVSFMVGKRGNDNINSLNEKYYGINLGVSIAPGFNDRWFRKYKID